jgi:two-component system, cell cycle sensor histidine kinase and response regulator CckA
MEDCLKNDLALERGRAEAVSIRGGRETILLVEDEAPLREIIQRMLRGLGYAVLASGSPFEAIRTAERHEGAIALLITDVVMPGINGRVLAETLITARPEMKVLYASGYTSDACVEQGQLEPGWPLLEKPFNRDVLAKKVRELLDSACSDASVPSSRGSEVEYGRPLGTKRSA